MYIGGTKSGALFGEAVVFFNTSLVGDFQYTIKLRGALLAKGRLLGIQFNDFSKDNLYEKIGKHANEMALRLKNLFTENGIEFLNDSYSNQLFVILPNNMVKEIEKKIYNNLYRKT